jgi:hypothetical protein
MDIILYLSWLLILLIICPTNISTYDRWPVSDFYAKKRTETMMLKVRARAREREREGAQYRNPLKYFAIIPTVFSLTWSFCSAHFPLQLPRSKLLPCRGQSIRSHSRDASHSRCRLCLIPILRFGHGFVPSVIPLKLSSLLSRDPDEFAGCGI